MKINQLMLMIGYLRQLNWEREKFLLKLKFGSLRATAFVNLKYKLVSLTSVKNFIPYCN